MRLNGVAGGVVLNLGGATTVAGALSYLGVSGTGAGETSAKCHDLAGTTGVTP